MKLKFIAVSKFYNNFGAWFKNSRKVVQGSLDPLTQEEIDNNENVLTKRNAKKSKHRFLTRGY